METAKRLKDDEDEMVRDYAAELLELPNTEFLGITSRIDVQVNNFQKPVRYSRPDRFNTRIYLNIYS